MDRSCDHSGFHAVRVQFLCQVHVLHKSNYILKLLGWWGWESSVVFSNSPFSFGQFAIEFCVRLEIVPGPKQWKLYVCAMYNNMKSKTSSNLTDIVLAHIRTLAHSCFPTLLNVARISTWAWIWYTNRMRIVQTVFSSAYSSFNRIVLMLFLY